MTFEDFEASHIMLSDDELPENLSEYYSGDGVKHYMYIGKLIISEQSNGEFYLRIGNVETVSNRRMELEQKHYGWACSEGYV